MVWTHTEACSNRYGNIHTHIVINSVRKNTVEKRILYDAASAIMKPDTSADPQINFWISLKKEIVNM